MTHIDPSDFCPSNKDKTMLNWYCYEMALGLGTALEEHKEDPSTRKWLKNATIPGMILDITDRLKHVIVTKDLSSAISLKVSPSWIQHHVREMPPQKCNDIATNLTRAIQDQAEECKNCPMNCLRFKNHPCSLFDDPAYRIPPGANARGGTRTMTRAATVSKTTDRAPGSSNGGKEGVSRPRLDRAKSIVTGYIEAMQSSVKDQTRRVHERVLQSWLEFIQNHVPREDALASRSGRGDDATTAGNKVVSDSGSHPGSGSDLDENWFYEASLRDFIHAFEFLQERFATSTTVLKQVPAVLKKFINHVACNLNIDAKTVDTLLGYLDTLRAEIIAYIADTEDFDEVEDRPLASAARGTSSRSKSDGIARMVESPEVQGILQDYMDGTTSKAQLASRLFSAMGIPMDTTSTDMFERFVAPFADECAKTAKSTGKDIRALLDDDDSATTNFDEAMAGIRKIPRADIAQLIDVTAAVFTIAPWKRLADTQLIGVKDPATGTVWYCSIMGKLGQHVGIMAYPGDEGLASYLAMATCHDQPLSELFLRQSGLYLAYENKDHLEAPDTLLLEMAHPANVTARCYPQFRDFTPGYFPWILSADQVRLLAMILSQVLDIARGSAKALRRVPDIQFDHSVLVRERVDRPGQPEAWREVITPAPRTNPAGNRYPFFIASRPEMRLDKVPAEIAARVAAIQQSKNRRASNSSSIVDFEFFHTLMNTQDGSERPYYPDMMIAVDHASGFVYNTKLVKPGVPRVEIAAAFLDVLASCDRQPAAIHVLSSATAAVVEPVASLLGVKIDRKDHLRPLEDAILALKAEFED